MITKDMAYINKAYNKMNISGEHYADKINIKFSEQDANYVDLKQRLGQYATDWDVSRIESACQEFKRNNKDKEWKSFSNLSLCQGKECPIDRILIDTTRQRRLMVDWICNIISKFKQSKVMAIQVYKHPDKPGYYVAWDGQHTAISLYIIITKIFGDELANCIVPIVEYPYTSLAEMRENFVDLNGDAKKPLDDIDHFQQMVFGVRIDGMDKPKFVETERKQQHLENYKLFATHQKYADTDKPGAISRLNEIMKDPPENTLIFAKYFTALNQSRAVDPKEIVMMSAYFNECQKQDIDLTDDYINELAFFIRDYFDADFSPHGKFWDKMSIAYYNWHEEHWADISEDDPRYQYPRVQKEPAHGMHYLTACLRKHTELKVPKYDNNSSFRPLDEDL